MGAYLSAPITDKDSSDGEGPTCRWGASGMQGWRKGMEDAHITVTNFGGVSGDCLFGVFDGHGGQEVATFCEHHMPEVVLKNPDYRAGAGDAEATGRALVSTFHRMDELVMSEENFAELESYKTAAAAGAGTTPAAAGQSPAEMKKNITEKMQGGGALTREDAYELMMKMMELKKLEESAGGGADAAPAKSAALDAGCTSVVVAVRDKTIVCANAGDSRAVLCRAGKAVPLSFDHKPSSQIEIDRITRAGGYITEQGRINGNLNLSRSLGDCQYKLNKDLPPSAQVITAEPDILVETIHPEDEFMILACDGVWDIMSNQQAVDFVRSRIASAASLSSICEEVFDHCIAPDVKANQGLGCDNMTCVVVAFRH